MTAHGDYYADLPRGQERVSRVELLSRGPDDELTVTVTALALLVDLPVEEVVPAGTNDWAALPAEWVKSGRRRASEAKAQRHDGLGGGVVVSRCEAGR